MEAWRQEPSFPKFTLPLKERMTGNFSIVDDEDGEEDEEKEWFEER